MSIFHAEFTTGQVLTAADVTNSALQSWIRRNLIVGHKGHEIDMPGSPGIRRKYSFYNVMEIAIAKGLIDIGMDLTDAFKAAITFSHFGDAERLPSLPFRDAGFTLLCVAGQRSGVFFWVPGRDIMDDIRYTLLRPQGWVTLDAGQVFNHVTATLGYHPEEVIEETYKSFQDTHREGWVNDRSS